MIFVISIFVCAVATGSALPQDEDERGVTPVMRAVRDGEHKELKNLINKGADLNAKDPRGWTALYYALIRNDEKL